MARTPLSGCRASQQSMYTKADLAPGLQHADFPAAPHQALGLQQGEGGCGGPGGAHTKGMARAALLVYF